MFPDNEVRARRDRITVGASDCDPGRGACRSCDALYGNYHADGCARLSTITPDEVERIMPPAWGDR